MQRLQILALFMAALAVSAASGCRSSGQQHHQYTAPPPQHFPSGQPTPSPAGQPMQPQSMQQQSMQPPPSMQQSHSGFQGSPHAAAGFDAGSSPTFDP